jgi:hypothetical protein
VIFVGAPEIDQTERLGQRPAQQRKFQLLEEIVALKIFFLYDFGAASKVHSILLGSKVALRQFATSLSLMVLWAKYYIPGND